MGERQKEMGKQRDTVRQGETLRNKVEQDRQMDAETQ